MTVKSRCKTYVRKLLPRLEVMREAIKMNIDDYKANNKARIDVTAKPSGYEPGDRVWLHNPQDTHRAVQEID